MTTPYTTAELGLEMHEAARQDRFRVLELEAAVREALLLLRHDRVARAEMVLRQVSK